MVSPTAAYFEAVAVGVDSEVGCSSTVADGHSEAAEEALAVDDDGALSMVFRTLLLCHSLLCRDSSLVQNLCDHHSRGAPNDHSAMASKKTGSR